MHKELQKKVLETLAELKGKSDVMMEEIAKIENQLTDAEEADILRDMKHRSQRLTVDYFQKLLNDLEHFS